MGTGGAFPPGVKLTAHLNLVSRSRMVELYVRTPIRLHSAVLNYRHIFIWELAERRVLCPEDLSFESSQSHFGYVIMSSHSFTSDTVNIF
jgi:hypothetical protein